MDVATEVRDELRFLQTNKSFLGREFLTWLWFVTETHPQHKVEIPGLGEFKLFVDDKIVLSSAGGSVLENILKGGSPAYATEAQAALLEGKTVQEARFMMQDGERQWNWTMKADDLALRSVKLPPTPEQEPENFMHFRLQNLNILHEVILQLFRMYLEIRGGERFHVTLGDMRQWVESKQVH